MKHNLQQQSQRRARDSAFNPDEAGAGGARISRDLNAHQGHHYHHVVNSQGVAGAASSQKSTLKRSTQHHAGGLGADPSSAAHHGSAASSGLLGMQVASRLFNNNNHTNSKFSTISSYRQKRVSFMINADLENDLHQFNRQPEQSKDEKSQAPTELGSAEASGTATAAVDNLD